jgi:CheY-like chemotaxis protein
MEGRGLEPALRSSAQESPRSIAKFILVVEDDPDLGQLVAEVLESAGYRTAVAGNGAEALDCLQTIDHPDLILLDMMMPVMDGWQFASEFRARYGQPAPIIVVTAAEQVERRAQEIGADDWLSKPFELRDLLHAVARFCPLPETPEHWGLIGR